MESELEQVYRRLILRERELFYALDQMRILKESKHESSEFLVSIRTPSKHRLLPTPPQEPYQSPTFPAVRSLNLLSTRHSLPTPCCRRRHKLSVLSSHQGNENFQPPPPPPPPSVHCPGKMYSSRPPPPPSLQPQRLVTYTNNNENQPPFIPACQVHTFNSHSRRQIQARQRQWDQEVERRHLKKRERNTLY